MKVAYSFLLVCGLFFLGWRLNFIVSAAKVVELRTDNFDAELTKEKLAMVEFYAPWCIHCQRLQPEYEKATQVLDGLAMLAKVDCTVNEDLCNRFEVRGYPTIKIFRDQEPSEYNGERNSDAIVKKMKKEALPAITILNDAQLLNELLKDEKVVVVGFFDHIDQGEYKTFEKVAQKLRSDFLFVAILDRGIMSKYNIISVPSILLLKTFDEQKDLFEAAFSPEEIESFVRVHSIPLMDDIGPENFIRYQQSSLPLAYLFVETDQQRTEVGSIVKNVAREFRNLVNFVTVNATLYGPHANRLNLLKTEWPAFVIHDQGNNSKYPFDSSQSWDKETVRDFVQAVLDGKIEPFLRSQPIPEKNDGPVKVVVTKEFDKIVLDNKKDVLVEFYAPWCGHCKKLAPTYEQLGEIFKEDPNIVIAKMDASENDLPAKSSISIEGLPTIVLFQANSINHPVVYEGDRSLKDLLDFVREHAVNTVIEETNTKHTKEDL